MGLAPGWDYWRAERKFVQGPAAQAAERVWRDDTPSREWLE